MRVLHVCEVSWGGVVSLLHDFTREQSRRGHEVSLLAPPSFPAFDGLQHHPWHLDRRRPGTYPRALFELRRLIRKSRPDVVHLHSAVAGILGRLPALPAGAEAATVYQPHAWSFDLYGDKVFGRLLQSWERRASRRVQVLVANCADEVEEGRRIGISVPAHSLGVPLDGQRFHLVEEEVRQRYRQELGIKAPRMLLVLGRLARQKGQDLLVSSWEESPLPDTELLLAGPGDPAPLAELAPTQWGKTVRSVGEQHDVRPWLWASDLLVLPSRYETVAVVVAEAMACGRPVVASRVNGVEMAITDGPHPPAGTVVPAGEMDVLLKECQRRLDDPELSQREAMAGRKRALALFETSAVVDRLDAAYAQALRG